VSVFFFLICKVIKPTNLRLHLSEDAQMASFFVFKATRTRLTTKN